MILSTCTGEKSNPFELVKNDEYMECYLFAAKTNPSLEDFTATSHQPIDITIPLQRTNYRFDHFLVRNSHSSKSAIPFHKHEWEVFIQPRFIWNCMCTFRAVWDSICRSFPTLFHSDRSWPTQSLRFLLKLGLSWECMRKKAKKQKYVCIVSDTTKFFKRLRLRTRWNRARALLNFFYSNNRPWS